MNELVYIGCKRTIFALDLESGEEVWRARLPRLWGSQATLLVDGDSLLVARGAYIYRLDRWTGQMLWEHVVAEKPGYLAILATANSSQSPLALQQAAVVAAKENEAAANAAAAG